MGSSLNAQQMHSKRGVHSKDRVSDKSEALQLSGLVLQLTSASKLSPIPRSEILHELTLRLPIIHASLFYLKQLITHRLGYLQHYLQQLGE